MIILDATNKSLQFKLSGSVTTNQLPFSASYVDTTGSSTTPGEQDGISNNMTAVTIVSSPTSSTERLVKHIAIQNADTANAAVTIIYNNNSTLRNIFVATLAPGDQLIYEDGHGWSCLDANGNLKTSGSGGSSTGAWSSFTPTVAAGSGTITTSSASGIYNTLGKTVFWQAEVNITTAGTGIGGLLVGLPLAASSASSQLTSSGMEVNVTGKMVKGITNSTNYNVSQVTYYDNSSVIASGNSVVIGGTYESS